MLCLVTRIVQLVVESLLIEINGYAVGDDKGRCSQNADCAGGQNGSIQVYRLVVMNVFELIGVYLCYGGALGTNILVE